MSHKWDDAREKRLLLEVIAITDAKVEGSAWTRIAAIMGEGATAEACRYLSSTIPTFLPTALVVSTVPWWSNFHLGFSNPGNGVYSFFDLTLFHSPRLTPHPVRNSKA